MTCEVNGMHTLMAHCIIFMLSVACLREALKLLFFSKSADGVTFQESEYKFWDERVWAGGAVCVELFAATSTIV
jgi:hypothetical protein